MRNVNSYKLPLIENWLRSDLAMYFILTLIILLAYGYEIFNFNLTIDDELNVHRTLEDVFLSWLSQSRWGMSVISYIVLPYSIVPVVSIALGVSGITIGMLIILKSMFDIDRVGILFITALGATIPIFSFILVFNANAYGIGFGYIAIAIGSLLIHNKNVSSLILACLLAAFAIGTYQTFIFVLAIIVITQIWYFNEQAENKFLSLHATTYPVLFFIGSIIIYIIVNFTLQWFFSIKDQYTSSVINITDFINNPLKNLSFAYYQLLDIINLQSKFFGIQSIWLKIILFTSLVVMCINLFRQFRFTIKIIIISAIILLIIIFSLALTNRIILRSLIHVPFGIMIILAYSYTLSGKYMKPLFTIICGLVIVGNASINNHLSASAASAEFQDKMLAHTIINEVRRLKPENDQNTEYKIEVIGNHTWIANAIQSKTDLIGASFFQWDGGNKYRIAAYLRLNGLNAVALGDNKRIMRFYGHINSMPVWPKTGWISVIDDIVILKFNDYSELKKKELCSYGVKELCLELMPIVGLPKGYTENNSINCQGSIGNLNGIQGYKKIHESGLLLIKEDFSINGWLVTSSKSGVVSPDDVFITLKNSNDPILYSRASRYQREDIKTAFKKTNLNDAGYTKTIYISSLSGKYTLGIAIGHEGKLSQCSQFNIPINVE